MMLGTGLYSAVWGNAQFVYAFKRPLKVDARLVVLLETAVHGTENRQGIQLGIQAPSLSGDKGSLAIELACSFVIASVTAIKPLGHQILEFIACRANVPLRGDGGASVSNCRRVFPPPLLQGGHF